MTNGFHVVLHAAAGPTVPLGVSFEEVAERLAALDRLYFEPDGSFVWTGGPRSGEKNNAWQVDGMVYDRDGHVQYVELKGNAPPAVLERLFTALWWPDAKLAFQLPRIGITLDETEFRKHLEDGSD